MPVSLWPELYEDMETNDAVDTIGFAENLWPSPSDEDSLNAFMVDDDGWNVYNDDQPGGQWYTFVKNKNPPSMIIESITDYFEDDDPYEMEDPHPTSQGYHRPERSPPALTPIQEEKRMIRLNPPPIVPKSSPTGKLRSSLSKLSCFVSPPKTPLEMIPGGQITPPTASSPALTLGDMACCSPTDVAMDEDEFSLEMRRPVIQKSNWMHKANLNHSKMIISMQQLDMYCGGPSGIRKMEVRKSEEDSHSSSESSCNTSSIAGCNIDQQLARSLDFRCTPEKERMTVQKSLQDKERNFQGNVGNESVTERRKWLMEAFHKKPCGSSDESDMSSQSGPQTAPRLASTIKKFGGPPKTAVQLRKEEWERKWANKMAEQKSSLSKPKFSIKTQWEHGNDGSYKKRIVVESMR